MGLTPSNFGASLVPLRGGLFVAMLPEVLELILVLVVGGAGIGGTGFLSGGCVCMLARMVVRRLLVGGAAMSIGGVGFGPVCWWSVVGSTGDSCDDAVVGVGTNETIVEGIREDGSDPISESAGLSSLKCSMRSLAISSTSSDSGVDRPETPAKAGLSTVPGLADVSSD